MKYLNNGQLSLIDVIEEENKVIISAPTSFGKTSLLIEYILKEMVITKKWISPVKQMLEKKEFIMKTV